MKTKSIFTMVVLVALPWMIGCGDGLATLHGRATVDGEPAPKGISFRFQPIDGGSPSYATTDENGAFEAMFSFKKKGVEPGNHRVSLTAGSSLSGTGLPTSDQLGKVGRGGGQLRGASSDFPREYYAEITTLEVASGKNEDVLIELNTKP